MYGKMFTNDWFKCVLEARRRWRRRLEDVWKAWKVTESTGDLEAVMRGRGEGRARQADKEAKQGRFVTGGQDKGKMQVCRKDRISSTSISRKAEKRVGIEGKKEWRE